MPIPKSNPNLNLINQKETSRLYFNVLIKAAVFVPTRSTRSDIHILVEAIIPLQNIKTMPTYIHTCMHVHTHTHTQ